MQFAIRQTSYNAEQTTVTDQAGKQRKSVVDGLGRLVKVFEDPGSSNFETDYTYDALGNLMQVDQGTQQHRVFSLDSQITSSGVAAGYSMSYGYDLAGNLITETYPSGRQVITEYDSAGRTAGIRAAGAYYAGATATDATNRIQYAAQGAVSAMKLGNGKWEHTLFNARLQPIEIG